MAQRIEGKKVHQLYIHWTLAAYITLDLDTIEKNASILELSLQVIDRRRLAITTLYGATIISRPCSFPLDCSRAKPFR